MFFVCLFCFCYVFVLFCFVPQKENSKIIRMCNKALFESITLDDD